MTAHLKNVEVDWVKAAIGSSQGEASPDFIATNSEGKKYYGYRNWWGIVDEDGKIWPLEALNKECEDVWGDSVKEHASRMGWACAD